MLKSNLRIAARRGTDAKTENHNFLQQLAMLQLPANKNDNLLRLAPVVPG
jgi:hypothetical protein